MFVAMIRATCRLRGKMNNLPKKILIKVRTFFGVHQIILKDQIELSLRRELTWLVPLISFAFHQICCFLEFDENPLDLKPL